MEFFSLSKLGDPKIFQTKETAEKTRYVLVNMESSEDIINTADGEAIVTTNNSDDIVYTADEKVMVTTNDSDDFIFVGSCQPEPGLYETNKGLFYSLVKFFGFVQPSPDGVTAPDPFWIGEQLMTENPLLDSGKIDIII